jgi:hypothetical protein
MTVQEAARTLYETFSDRSWFTAVGAGHDHGRECIVLYVRRRDPEVIRLHSKDWLGYRVIVRRASTPQLLAEAL